jgi:hypothetical protein
MTKPKNTNPKKPTAPAAKSKAPKKNKAAELPVAPSQAETPAGETGSKPPRKESKLDLLIGLLKRPEGATIDDMTEATGWQKHTVRAALSHALAKKRGYQIVSEKPQGGKRSYKITEPPKDDH